VGVRLKLGLAVGATLGEIVGSADGAANVALNSSTTQHTNHTRVNVTGAIREETRFGPFLWDPG
jgi:hypothetical protein